MSGRIILLNGASSSGKSSIAQVLQNTLDGIWLHTGVDHWLERLPLAFHGVGDGTSDHLGVTWVIPDGSRVTELRLGPVGLRVLGGAYSAYAALAADGNDLIVDDVIFDPRLLRLATERLVGSSVLFVGVRCPTDVAEAREAARGDRFTGLASCQSDLVHTHAIYDLEVDTSTMSPEECAELIRSRVSDGPPPSAFDRLRATFSA
jgi:chloramphenicol 3-O phosphotransferase